MVADGNDFQISGDVLDDRLEGRGGVDLLVGLDGDDMLDGGSGDDTAAGRRGRDLLTGGSGNDQVDGGAGDDTVVYSGNRPAYTVTFTANGYSVSGPRRHRRADGGRIGALRRPDHGAVGTTPPTGHPAARSCWQAPCDKASTCTSPRR